MKPTQYAIFWHRRDLRTHDNHGLQLALLGEMPVLPIFIFDTTILGKLTTPHDKRVAYIHNAVSELAAQYKQWGTALQVYEGTPTEVFAALFQNQSVCALHYNRDYEPAAIVRDTQIEKLAQQFSIATHSYKDQVIFEPSEVLKKDGTPYTVFTPYSKIWLAHFAAGTPHETTPLRTDNFLATQPAKIPSLETLGFVAETSKIPLPNIAQENWTHYNETRDFPALDTTTRLSVHLRFGTLSIREVAKKAAAENATLLNELIWREFYMAILLHFPYVAEGPFKRHYQFIAWRNDETEFEAWCNGRTGYPIVDAGMRQLNATGFMHNRVRMITASFLCKHLLIDWQWGEAYFAEKLLDFELASNNGGWQWAASTGCDAVPYFRFFNPSLQEQKFDPEQTYIRRWLPEFGTEAYPQPIVAHVYARERCLAAYAKVAKNKAVS
jgi:deoxyribodipyrimidine photo-lyase